MYMYIYVAIHVTTIYCILVIDCLLFAYWMPRKVYAALCWRQRNFVLQCDNAPSRCLQGSGVDESAAFRCVFTETSVVFF